MDQIAACRICTLEGVGVCPLEDGDCDDVGFADGCDGFYDGDDDCDDVKNH